MSPEKRSKEFLQEELLNAIPGSSLEVTCCLTFIKLLCFLSKHLSSYSLVPLEKKPIFCYLAQLMDIAEDFVYVNMLKVSHLLDFFQGLQKHLKETRGLKEKLY